MTSINAIRVNRNVGILLCDEASYWNEEWMILYTPDKIQAVIGSDFMERAKIALFIGMSGSSMMGERVMDGIANSIDKFRPQIENAVRLKIPLPLILDDLAHEAFNVATKVKMDFVDDYLASHFGFSTAELVAGQYTSNGKTISLEDEKIRDEAMKYLTYKDEPPEVAHAFKNTLFVAGYTPREGFRMFFMNTLNPVIEEVADIYVVGGSGSDTTDLVYSDFAARKTVVNRRQGLDKIDAAIAAFRGLATACRLTAGVAPYPNFIYLDGNSNTFIKKIFDSRSYLAQEIVTAGVNGYVSNSVVRSLVSAILFEDKDFHYVNEQFHKKAKDTAKLDLFLRGYSISNNFVSHSAPIVSSLKV